MAKFPDESREPGISPLEFFPLEVNPIEYFPLELLPLCFTNVQDDNDVARIIYAHEQVEKYLCAANYVVLPLEKHVFINRSGKMLKEREKFFCKIQIDGAHPQKFTIKTKDIKRLAVIVGDEFSEAQINSGIPNATKSVENTFRDATKGIPVVRHFVDYGWQKIDGKLVYGHDDQQLLGNKVFLTGMRLPSYGCTREQVGDIFFDAYNLYKEKGSMGTMIAFSMLGVLYRVFDEAGHAPRFLLFINGRTGSMKTTLSKILYVQLADGMYRDTPRRIDADTITSFERGIVLSGRDTVTLIDDYAPAKSNRQKIDNEEKLERLIRMIGDRSTKSRSNPDLEDCRGEGVQGVVALTGELTGTGLSSNLRCFYCGIQRECVNVDMVTRFQDDVYLYTTLIQNVAFFVAENWEQIVGYVKGNFRQERLKVGRQLSERRLIDSTVIMRFTCDIISEFLVKYCGRDALEVNGVIDEMKNGIMMMASISEQISLEETIAVRVAKIIDQHLQSRNFNMLERRPDAKDLNKIDGFYDTDFYYFLPEKPYEKVRQVFCSGNIYLPLNLDEMVKALHEEKIIMATSNGVGKKVYYARIPIGEGKKRNFIKIRKETLRTVVDE